MTESKAAREARLGKDASAAPDPVTPGTIWDRLARPFPEDEVEKLPRNVQRDDRDKGRCESGSRYSADGSFCGGWHARSVHLDYVGHAGITMRLNEVLTPGGWEWDPVARNEDGTPKITNGGLWINLRIMEIAEDGIEIWVSKLGYGDAPGKGGDVTKELIGDALRNAAMRFGVATYLWSKSERAKASTDDLTIVAPAPSQASNSPQAGDKPGDPDPLGNNPPTPEPSTAHVGVLTARVQGMTPSEQEELAKRWKAKGWPKLNSVPVNAAAEVNALIDAVLAEADIWAAAPAKDEPPF